MLFAQLYMAQYSNSALRSIYKTTTTDLVNLCIMVWQLHLKPHLKRIYSVLPETIKNTITNIQLKVTNTANTATNKITELWQTQTYLSNATLTVPHNSIIITLTSLVFMLTIFVLTKDKIYELIESGSKRVNQNATSTQKDISVNSTENTSLNIHKTDNSNSQDATTEEQQANTPDTKAFDKPSTTTHNTSVQKMQCPSEVNITTS